MKKKIDKCYLRKVRFGATFFRFFAHDIRSGTSAVVVAPNRETAKSRLQRNHPDVEFVFFR